MGKRRVSSCARAFTDAGGGLAQHLLQDVEGIALPRLAAEQVAQRVLEIGGAALVALATECVAEQIVQAYAALRLRSRLGIAEACGRLRSWRRRRPLCAGIDECVEKGFGIEHGVGILQLRMQPSPVAATLDRSYWLRKLT